MLLRLTILRAPTSSLQHRQSIFWVVNLLNWAFRSSEIFSIFFLVLDLIV